MDHADTPSDGSNRVCEDLEAGARGVTYVQLREPHMYKRHPPCLSNASADTEEKLANFYTMISQRDVACPGEGYFHFDECDIYASAYIFSEAGWFEPSTIDWLPLSDRPVLATMARSNMRQDLADTTPTVVICKAGFNNYGHVISEILPKLINLHRSGLKKVRIILSSDMSKFFDLVSNIMRYFEILFEPVVVAANEMIHARNVLFFSAVSRHDSRKSATFREFIDVLYAVTGVRPVRERKIFVDRAPHEIRHVVNASNVHDIFQARGYTVVHPSGMTVEEQIELFAKASHVAGPLGAGLANIAFAPPGSKIFMIDPGLIDYFFWDMSCIKDQQFHWYLTRQIAGWSAELSAAPISVDEGHLRAVLEINNL